MPLAWDFDSSCLENLAIFTVPMKAHTETPDVPLLGPCDSAWVDSHLTIFAIPEHILMFRTHNTWIVILTWWCDDHGTTGVTLLLRRTSFRTLVRRGARIVAPLKRAVIATRIAVHPITIVTFFIIFDDAITTTLLDIAVGITAIAVNTIIIIAHFSDIQRAITALRATRVEYRVKCDGGRTIRSTVIEREVPVAPVKSTNLGGDCLQTCIGDTPLGLDPEPIRHVGIAQRTVALNESIGIVWIPIDIVDAKQVARRQNCGVGQPAANDAMGITWIVMRRMVAQYEPSSIELHLGTRDEPRDARNRRRREHHCLSDTRDHREYHDCKELFHVCLPPFGRHRRLPRIRQCDPLPKVNYF